MSFKVKSPNSSNLSPSLVLKGTLNWKKKKLKNGSYWFKIFFEKHINSQIITLASSWLFLVFFCFVLSISEKAPGMSSPQSLVLRRPREYIVTWSPCWRCFGATEVHDLCSVLSEWYSSFSWPMAPSSSPVSLPSLSWSLSSFSSSWLSSPYSPEFLR